MKTLRTFNVSPVLPDKLNPLKEIAYNMWWAWDHDAQELFMRVDPQLWDESSHNPVRMLSMVSHVRLQELVDDAGFYSHLESVLERFRAYTADKGWFYKNYQEKQPKIAYFSAEFGLAESLPIYSGGLGVLAGDHLKAASDLAVPLVGVGLLYRSGYFTQRLNADGWQQETYTDNDWSTLPVTLIRNDKGRPVQIQLEYPEGLVTAHIWQVKVGRIMLYLLDTNIPENGQAARDITSQLYAGDREMRIRQEILLGVGGMRALKEVGYNPDVCHMNEGHSAFLALERICDHMDTYGLSFDEALEATKASNIFTTHTPVPAGNDEFSPALTERYLKPWQQRMGLTTKELFALGRINPADANETFCMTVLAIKLSSYRNGVSELHGHVSRKMWQGLYPEFPQEDIPIASITNGVHFKSWISRDLAQLYDRYLGPKWHEDADNHSIWERIDQIPEEELWMTHERRRERLVAFTRKRLSKQLERRGATRADVHLASEALQPDALTIGFARRFATYKRGTLLFRNFERLEKILNNEDRPVQFIFAGKAHPRDDEGKHLIRQIIHTVRNSSIRNKFVFLEDYDIDVGRRLVQGVDIWLNTPRRPLEASGTSGMKASANGVLNLSVLDGWWCEAYNEHVGWSIGKGEEYHDLNYQDEVESNAIYDLLEKEIVPLFYDRGDDGMPREWIKTMKGSMKSICPVFNTSRMVEEYTKKGYIPGFDRYCESSDKNFEKAKTIAAWTKKIKTNWPNVKIERVDTDIPNELVVDEEFEVTAVVSLAELKPEDVMVEVVFGKVNAIGEMDNGKKSISLVAKEDKGGRWNYHGKMKCDLSGKMGLGVRVIPYNSIVENLYDLALIRWA